MTEFERAWAHAEREQHDRRLYQLKREILAKRQAEQAQARLQKTNQPPQLELSSTSPSAQKEVERPLQKRQPS